jgi:hypothetical protein
MVPRKMRAIAVAIAALFTSSDIAAAMPIAPMNDSGGISPILVRGGRGGGARAGGFHGGGARGFHGGGARVHHGGVAVRGGAYRGAAVRGGVYRGAAVRGAWARGYRWPAGGAIAAGAAVGFLTAGAAAAYATTRAPAAGLCWYYTDASRSSGFWDTCP